MDLVTPLLYLVGFVAGLLTIASPCILPVLPAVLASAMTTGGARRALAIASGLALMFGLSALFSIRLLQALGLPLGLRYDLAIVVLFILAASMLIPKIGEIVERPFARLGLRRSPDGTGSGLILGASLGLLYLPCGGPILATIAAVGGSTHSTLSAAAIGLTVAYSFGVALPMFALILLASRVTRATDWLRGHAVAVRRTGGALIAVSALLITFGAATTLQTKLPSYTASIEQHLTSGSKISGDLHSISDPGESQAARHIQRSVTEFSKSVPMADMADQVPTIKAMSLQDYGAAPNFGAAAGWLNTPGDRPLSIASLRGKVVLVDFWTYSCINCLRSLPHVKAWYSRYKKDGLVVVGVHTPEFDFEHQLGNVSDAVKRLGITYPVDVDSNYTTWNNWGNDSWPADYLIDQQGQVRYASVGEGDYGQTEAAIRALLSKTHPNLPPPTSVPDATPDTALTPESYLGYERLARYVGTPVTKNTSATYVAPSTVPANHLSYDGQFTVKSQEVIAGQDAAIELNYHADDVYLVLGGSGTASVSVDGKQTRAFKVSGVPALYTLVSGSQPTDGLLKVSLSPGVQAYDFTFG